MQDVLQFLSIHSYLTGAIIFVFVLLTIIELLRAKRNTSSLEPANVVQLINQQNAMVIDTRTQDQFRKGHIINALHIPSHELRESTKKLEKYKSKPIVFICNSGIETQKISSRLIREGYHAYSLRGGMRSWYDAQLPVLKE